MSVPRQTAGTMRTCDERRTMTIVAENAEREPERERVARAASARRDSASDTMMTMPTRTAAIAAQVGPATRSPNAAQASSAAISGALACTSRMLATVVYCSAMTKEVEALANSSATARPGQPHRPEERDRAALAPSRTSMKPKRKTLAQTDRQKTIVQDSIPSPSSRPKVPPKLQATAEAEDQPRPGAGLGERDGRRRFHCCS